MLLRVVKFGEKVLKEKSAPVEVFDSELKAFAGDLLETMLEENGLGLAAPQVGVLRQIFVIDMRRRSNTDVPCVFTIDGKSLPLDLAMPLFAVNPQIEEVGEYVIYAEEGCLSFPGIYAEVERSEKIILHYQDLEGTPHELHCDGLFARCVQHEFDHLEGVSFVDRLEPKQLFKIESGLKKLRRQTRDFLKESKNGKK